METEINIVEILKDKPANTKLYSPLFSEVFFSHVSGGYKNYVPGRYTCVTQHFHIEESNAAQIYIYNIEEKIGGKLDLKTLEIEKPKCEFKTFDKVLGRNEKDDVWEADLFSHYREESQYPFRCIGFSRKYCIPYNKETAHLLGTTDDWEGGEQ